MELDQSRSVASDRVRELSDLDHRTTKDIANLERKIQGLREILQKINRTLSEFKHLRQQFDELASEDRGLPVGHGSRDGATTIENGPSGVQMSWDYEGVTRKSPVSYNQLENDAETLIGVITKLEAELATKKTKLEQVRQELHEHNQSEQDDDGRDINLETMEQLRNGMEQLTAEDEPTLLNKTRELEELANLQSVRIEELLEKNHVLENDLTTLQKQKDELLKVNHQWDQQYRLLKDDKERTIAELRNQLQRNITTEVNQQSDDTEYSVPRAGQQQIIELRRKRDELAEEVARLQEKQAKTDKLWLSAKKMITEEREARMAATEQTKVIQERYTQLQHELMNEKETQLCLKQEIERLVAGEDRNSSLSSLSPNVKEQIEMLKQQIRVYADDFANERSDRERIQTDREELKEKLKTCENEIELLKEQIRVYQDDFKKERYEKERLQRQVRGGRQWQNDDPWIIVPPNDYNPVQRRPMTQFQQPYGRNEKNDNYRGQATPREIQEYAFQQQLQARGSSPSGHPGALCHGCEADGHDVIDGSSTGRGVLKCPRCDRQYSVNERRAFDDHIDKCTI